MRTLRAFGCAAYGAPPLSTPVLHPQPSPQPDTQLWLAVKPLLTQVLSLAPELRWEQARQLTANNPPLQAELLSLLAAHDSADEVSPLTITDSEFVLGAIDRHLPSPWIGRTLGGYRVDSLWARGGMGEIYLGHRLNAAPTAPPVAIKCMRSSLDWNALAPRFERERQILSSLKHPHLAEVFDTGISDDGLPYIVMEFVEGLPLDQYCEQHVLPLDQRLDLFITVCHVVHDIHQKGVIHRDLKFNNILVNNNGVVKLVDFGIAKRMFSVTTNTNTPPHSDTRTAPLLQALTLSAASPEQVAGGDITPASDIYSLGVLLYRLLTQLSPYHTVDEHNSFELMRAICCPTQAPPAPSRVRGTDLTRTERQQLRGNLDAITRMALQKNSHRRYDSALSLAEDIDRHRRGLRARARNHTGMSLARLWVHRLHMRLFERPAALG